MDLQAKPALVLASGSPRRKQLLESSGFKITVIVSHMAEIPRPGEIPKAYALRNACEKGLLVSNQLTQGELVISADTIVVTKDGVLLEKPRDAAHAKEMLTLLSNNAHMVYTGYAISQYGVTRVAKVIETKVYFRVLSPQEIDNYIASGEPFDKSGSYGVQGQAAGFVERIEGSYTNVMGLPLSHVILDLRELCQS